VSDQRDAAQRAEIEACISDRAFTLVYQPIVHLDAGTVAGVEALTRFDDGASTERRFQQAERIGLSPDLDFAIIDVALDDLTRLDAEYLSINLSPSTLLDERLANVMLDDSIPPDQIVLEVTEHARITDYERAERQLTAIRGRGIRLAVDDAGAGYATFRHILSLRPDIIKMDRSITQDIDTDAARRALATALVIFGGELGATVIAEGVETDAEILALRRAGIHRGQGFSLARPQAPPMAALTYEPVPLMDLLDVPPLASEAIPAAPGETSAVAARRKLNAAVDALRAAEQRVADTVALGRKAGVTWDETAEILGMTRQGASKRYGRGRGL